MGKIRSCKLCRGAGILLAIFIAATFCGCTTMGGQAGPPPNPVGQQSQPGAESPPPAYSSTPPSGSSAHPIYYDFQDIPIPQELDLQDEDSYVFQYGGFKAGLLTFRGRVDIHSLISFFQMAMPRDNWKSKGGFRYRRSVLLFEKADKTCIINLFEKTFYTYVEIYVAPTTGQV